MYDPELYRDRTEVEEWKHRDPLTLLAGRLRQAGAFDEADEARLEAEIAGEIDAAVAAAEAGTLGAGRRPDAIRVQRDGGVMTDHWRPPRREAS